MQYALISYDLQLILALMGLPPGSTDPELIAAQMQLAEDARQHAHADAALTIERRAQTRFSDQFLNSLQPGDVLAWAQTGGETS
jgi:hypothetical protein